MSPNAAARLYLRPRWYKVLADLWSNRVRTLLVVASIAVGLFAVGLITTMYGVLSADLRAGYAARNPANIIIHAADFDDELVELVRDVDGVAQAEGLRIFHLMVRTQSGAWNQIALNAGPDFSEQQINQVRQKQGVWPPDGRQIIIERNKLDEVYLSGQPGVGGMVELKLPSGKIRQVALGGVVQDMTLGAGGAGGFFLAPIQGYLDDEMLAWLEQPESYNRLLVTVAGSQDPNDLRQISNHISEEIEDYGGLVYNSQTYGSQDHPNAAYVDAISAVLFVLGALLVFLSAFLITNTLSALLNQQAQQIAIMKMIGARSFQVTVMYMVLILIFGLLALAISLPLSRAAAFRLIEYLSYQINFEVLSYRSVPWAVALQVVIALVVPQVAGILPILSGSRVKVQDVLTGKMIKVDLDQQGWLDRRLARVKGFSRSQLLSLRNTFRHKGRLVLTLVTLTLGGSIYIATFNVRASLDTFVERVGHYFMADVNITLDQSYRVAAIEEALRSVPGVRQIEGWSFGSSELLLENDKAGDAMQLLGPPVESGLIDPIMLSGRWILPGDQNAIVLSERFISRFPGIKVGDTLRLRVNGKKSDWVVVGFFQLVGKSAGLVAYTSAEYLSDLLGEEKRAPAYRVIAGQPDLSIESQRALGAQIEEALQARGFGVIDVSAGGSLVEDTSQPLNVLTAFLLIMAVLTALVGSIGLMGTMSMNVLDRTREIGVLRAIGASDRRIMRLVITEGLLIGLISFVLSVLLAIPISKLLSDTIHMAVFDARSAFQFTVVGPLSWLVLVLVLSVLASFLPARNAARLTIREALAYA